MSQVTLFKLAPSLQLIITNLTNLQNNSKTSQYSWKLKPPTPVNLLIANAELNANVMVSAIYLVAMTAKRMFANSKTVDAALNASVVVTVKELLNAVKIVIPVNLLIVNVELPVNVAVNARVLKNVVRIVRLINARALAVSAGLSVNAMVLAV